MKRGNPTEHPGVLSLGQGQWIVRVTARDRTGTRREAERKVTGELVDALQAQRRLRTEFTAEHAGPPPRAKLETRETLGAFAARWLEYLATTGRARPHVVEQHRRYLERFILPDLGGMLLHDVDAQTLLWWQSRAGAMRQAEGAPYAHATLLSAWSCLRAMLRKAVVMAQLPHDPTSGVSFDVVGTPAKERATLTQEQAVALLHAAREESPDVCAMVWVQLTTGMRFCEVSALRWEDVDFEAHTVAIRRSHVRGVMGQPKTRGSYRRPTLLPEVEAMLRAHREWQKQHHVVGELVFPSRAGTPRMSPMMDKPLQRCAERAGIKVKVTSHALRRTLNNLVRQEAGDIVARAFTGHTTEAMTEHYSDVGAKEKMEAQRGAFGDLTAALAGGDARWGSEQSPPATAPVVAIGQKKALEEPGLSSSGIRDLNPRLQPWQQSNRRK